MERGFPVRLARVRRCSMRSSSGLKLGWMVITLAGALARSVATLSWKEAGVPPNEICAEPVSVAIAAKKLPMRSLEVAGFFLFIKDFFDRIYAFVFDKGGDQKKQKKLYGSLFSYKQSVRTKTFTSSSNTLIACVLLIGKRGRTSSYLEIILSTAFLNGKLV